VSAIPAERRRSSIVLRHAPASGASAHAVPCSSEFAPATMPEALHALSMPAFVILPYVTLPLCHPSVIHAHGTAPEPIPFPDEASMAAHADDAETHDEPA